MQEVKGIRGSQAFATGHVTFNGSRRARDDIDCDMRRANEVGGDYYDYHISGEGVCLWQLGMQPVMA